MKYTILILFAALITPTQAQSGELTVDEAQAFMDRAEARLMELSIGAERAAWVAANFITMDTELIAAQADEERISAIMTLAKEAAKFNKLHLPEDLARKMNLLKLATTLPAPSDSALSKELTKTVVGMKGMYGKGTYTRKGSAKAMSLGEMSQIMAYSTNEKELLDVWQGWRTISKPMKQNYSRYVELANQGAVELGYANVGEMWCSKYDMPAEDFPKELDRLWEQVKPLYISLHAFVRMKLRDHYGKKLLPKGAPIPAHLLGNMWAQSWGNIYPLLGLKDADPGYDLTGILRRKKETPVGMIRHGENFFSSLGFTPLPDTFWSRSLFTKPQDRDVVCHASAWCVDWEDDLRIKMCIEINEEDFITIHHELGHNYYQRAYNEQSFLFRDSANDGFHEAVGDTIALSATPEYLVKLGFIDSAPDPSKDVGLLLKMALEKIAFLPFGLLIDQWRWKVFAGEITPENYNQKWWELRGKYQGIVAPVERTEEDFDPGAKYHVASNVPYTRYFLAHILQFQFHRELTKLAGETGPMHRRSIYNSKKAGKALNDMLAMGSVRPWPEALAAMTGSTQMDAGAVIEYFAPLQEWLDVQLKNEKKGW